MKWLSFNYRGLDIPAKKLALRRLLESEKFDVIFLQETLEDIVQIVTLLEAIISC